MTEHDELNSRNVICRDKRGFFLESFEGQIRVRSRYFDTWDEARAEQIKLDAELNSEAKKHVEV